MSLMLRTLFVGLITVVVVNSLADYKGHGTETVNSETLKKYAPPDISPELKNQLRNYLDVTSPGMGMLSPDKKTLYFSWKVTGQTHIWKIDGPKGFPIQLTSGNDSVTLKAVSENGKFLIISKDLNGQENPGLYQLDLKSGQITELYRKEKVQAGFSFLTDDSKYLYFSANDKKSDSYSTYKMNLETKAIETIYDGDGNWYVADYKKNGEKLLFVKYRGGMINEFYEFDPKTKNMEPLIGQGEESEYEVSYSAKDNEYFVSTFKDDFRRLFLMKNKKLQLISDAKLKSDISGFSTDDKREKLFYSINDRGYTRLKVLNAKTLKEISVPDFNKLVGQSIDHLFAGATTKDGSVTMLGVVTAQYPRVSFSYNWKTKKMQQWVLPSAPQVDLKKFVPAELMEYEARDGVKIPMFVRFPEGCKKSKDCKVIVHFHGGPEGQSTPGFSPMWQVFVEQGFVVVEPNVRGSDGYGKTWIDSDNGPKRENVITDIEDASVWIRKNWKNNKGESPKIGVMGWSYGGYSTLMAMTRFAGSYDAGVALVGMSDLRSFLLNTAPYRRVLRISEYGDPERDKAALIKLSPVTYVDQVKAPLMIIQGVNDPRVPAGEAIQIQERLQKNKMASQLILFPDEGHGSAKKENQILEIGNTIEFFKKNL